MATNDSDATFCSEIEKGKKISERSKRYNKRHSQPVTAAERKDYSNSQQIIDSERPSTSKSQPVADSKQKNTRYSHPLTGPKRYQTRSSGIINAKKDELLQKTTKKRKLEEPVIQNGVKKRCVVSDTQKNQTSVKAAKKVPQSKLLKGKKSSKIVKPLRGRLVKKSLQSKLVSPYIPKGRSPKTKPKMSVTDQNTSSEFITLDQNVNEKSDQNNSIVMEESINLYDKKKAEPYVTTHNILTEKLKAIQNRGLKRLEQLKKDREEKENKEKSLYVNKAPITKQTIAQFDPFDPFMAPYTESLFSDTNASVPVAGSSKMINSINIQSTYSFFNDSDLPCAQKQAENIGNLMERQNSDGDSSLDFLNSEHKGNDIVLFLPSAQKQHINNGNFMEQQESDVDSFLNFFDSKHKENDFDNFSSSAQSVELNRSFFDTTPKNKSDDGPESSFVFDSDFEMPLSSGVAEASFIPTIPQISSEVVSQELNSQENKNEEESLNEIHGQLFSPLHLQLLARRLYLSEGFLKLCINKTFKEAMELMKLIVQQSLKVMETDSESHVSNSPEKEIRIKRASCQKITNDLFNIPIDRSIL